MRWVWRILGLGVFLLAAAAAFAVGLLWDFEDRGTVLGAEERVVEVARGERPAGLIASWRREGIVRDDPRWELWLRVRRPGACLQAGRHRLPVGASPREVFAILCQPTRAEGVRVTLPEGRNLWQAADLLSAAGLVDRSRFLSLAQQPALLGVEAPYLEGRLFPDTYFFDPRATEEAVLRRMVARFDEVVRPVLVEEAEALGRLEASYGLDVEAVFVLASLVEAEAVVDEERPRIAQVFLNRLRRGMRLQTDPTCVYNAERYGQVPTPRDCRDPRSVYSTYVIDGLPPTPIAGFGIRSLRAVLAPSGEEDILYFVAMRDGTGRHAFARTLQEHNANVRRYLRGGR